MLINNDLTKTAGQRAYEKYAEFQLHIPRMEIRPLTWEELGQCEGDLQEQWEKIAQAAISFELERLNKQALFHEEQSKKVNLMVSDFGPERGINHE